MNKVKYLVFIVVVVAMLFVAFLATLGGNGASAAPSLVPTPVSVSARGSAIAKDVVLYNGVVMTTAVASSAQGINEHEVIDLQWIIDQATLTNTLSINIQFSNNGVNWVDGPRVVTTNTADANDMQQYAIFGKYIRAYPSLENNNPVTITLIGVAK